MQLWHTGRMSHVSWADNAFLKSLNRPLPSVSCSATIAPGVTRGPDGNKYPHQKCRALTKEEIEGQLVDDFVLAAQAAKRCGFDFVEIHGQRHKTTNKLQR